MPSSSPTRGSLPFNVSWALAGRFSYALHQWLITVVLVRVGSAGDLGTYGLAMALVAPLFMLTALQLRDLAATEVSDPRPFAHFVQLRAVTTLLTWGIIAGIAPLSGLDREAAWVVAAFGLARGLESLSDIGYSLFQRGERLDLFGLSLLLKSILSLAGVTGLFLATDSLAVALLGMSAAWALVLVAFDLPQARRFLSAQDPLWARGDLRALGTLARLALPLGLTALLISLGTNLPRYLLESYRSREELGIYTAMASTLLAFGMINMAIGRATITRLARTYADGASHLVRLLKTLMGLSLAIGAAGLVGCLVAGEWFLEAVYGAAFAEHFAALILLMGARIGSLLYAHLKNTLVVFRRLRSAALLSAAGLAAGLLVGWITVPAHGLIGAAAAAATVTWTTCLGGLVLVTWLLRYRTAPEPAAGWSLLYIASDQRSGSTLLEQLLANHPEAVSLGEVRHLQREREAGHLCGCGQPIDRCEFWSPFQMLPTAVERPGRRGTHRPYALEVALVVAGPRLLRVLQRIWPTARRARNTIEHTWQVAEAVQASTGCRVVIDASKVADHAKLLYATHPERFRMVYLIRDGRGVVFSKRKRHPDLSLAQAAKSWVLNNLRLRAVQWNIPTRQRLAIQYEDLCRSPDTVLRELDAFLGLSTRTTPDPPPVQHGIAGSPHRGVVRLADVKEDVAWREEMTPAERKEIEAAMGRWLSRWGYGPSELEGGRPVRRPLD